MKKIHSLQIFEKAVFEFTYEENANRVAFALCSSGYIVKVIRGNDPFFKVIVYTTQ